MKKQSWLMGLGAMAVLAAAPAHAQFKRGDTLQSIGVGARAIGMGGAFVALSEDLTGIFWNPAGLSALTNPQAEIDFRMLPKTEFEGPGLFSGGEIGGTSLQFSFAGFAYPLGRVVGGESDSGGDTSTEADVQRKGVIAVARTLGGYTQTEIAGSFNTLNIARYWFNSIGYGQRLSSDDQFQVGIAAHYVELATLTPAAVGQNQGKGDGATFSLGARYRPKNAKGFLENTSYGLTYLHPTRVSDLGTSGAVFGQKISGRVAAGASKNFGVIGPGALLASLEGRYYFGGDTAQGLLEQRGDVGDVHFGGEYTIQKPNRTYFLRGGFYTRNASDDRIFFNDRVLTFGAGVLQKNVRLDVAVEKSLVKGDPLVTTSLRWEFGRSTASGKEVKKPAETKPDSAAEMPK